MQWSGINTITSHPQNKKERRTHTKFDKRSRKTRTVNRMNSSFPNRWSFSYHNCKQQQHLFLPIFYFEPIYMALSQKTPQCLYQKSNTYFSLLPVPIGYKLVHQFLLPAKTVHHYLLPQRLRNLLLPSKTAIYEKWLPAKAVCVIALQQEAIYQAQLSRKEARDCGQSLWKLIWQTVYR